MTKVGDLRRRVALIAVRDYPDAEPDFCAGIDEQVEVVRRWWGDPALGADAFEFVAPTALKTEADVDQFVRDTGLKTAGAGDVLVVYVTGHGHRAPSGQHYLVLPAGDPARVARDGYRTADLASAVLHSDAEHVLVIANLCYAGTVHRELLATLTDLPATRRDLRTLAVILTADFDERPRVREFSTLLTRVHDQLRAVPDVVAPHLSIEQFMEQLDRAARSDPTRRLLDPLKVWPLRHSGTPSPCLPNPGYIPQDQIVEPARQQVAAGPSEITYWLDRASGRTGQQDHGWYFSGREALTTAVAEFLRTGTGVLAVTGTAGSGKSAILARAVTFSDPQFLTDPRYTAAATLAPADTVPPPGSIHAAVLARNKTSLQVLTELADALDAPTTATDLALEPEPVSDPAAQLRDRLRDHAAAHVARTGNPVTVVLDGLDEAIHPTRVVSDLIGPLARPATDGTRAVYRFIVGVRSARPPEPPTPAARPEPPDRRDNTSSAPAVDDTGATEPAGTAETAGATDPAGITEAAVVPREPDGLGLLDLLCRATQTAPESVLRTDGPGTADDIAAYVRAVLEGSPGIYGDLGKDRAALAGIVAQHVTPSFLDARLEVERRRSADELQDLTAPEWLAGLARGTVGQLVTDLTDPGLGHPGKHVLAVLRASAFALGEGIPWADIWPAVADAVHGDPIPDVDTVIRFVVQGRLSGYLARAEAAGRHVYRPAHERLTQVLQDADTELVPLMDRPPLRAIPRQVRRDGGRRVRRFRWEP